MLSIRPATEIEKADAARQWASSFQPHAHPYFGTTSCTIGSSKRTLAESLWKRAHQRIADDLTSECTVSVLVHEKEPDVVLGWVCHDGDLVHYVYTIPAARRKGIGTRLLKSIDAKRLSHTTEGGTALWESIR